MDKEPPVLGYSVPTLAEKVGVSDGLMWNEIRDGECESCLIGDRRIITPEQAERWLKRKAVRAKAVREQRIKERDGVARRSTNEPSGDKAA